MQQITTWICPICGHKNKIHADSERDFGLINVYCDIDDGGCEERFAIEISWGCTATVYKLVGVS